MGNQRVTTNISTGDVEIITGVGDLLAENNLSDVDSAATSRTNLGLEIGTDVLAPDGDASGLDYSTAEIPQTAVTGLTSALNARAMAGGVYLDGTGTGIFSESVSLVDSVLTFTADITLDEDGGGMLFSQGGNSGGWFISVAPSAQIQFIAKQTGSTLNHFLEQSTASLEASRSYHLAVVVDFTTASPAVTFYVDGEPFASTTTTAATGTYGESPPRNFGIGARDLGGSPSIFFKGTISNAAAFNTALTAAQIADLAEYGLTGWLARNPGYARGASYDWNTPAAATAPARVPTTFAATANSFSASTVESDSRVVVEVPNSWQEGTIIEVSVDVTSVTGNVGIGGTFAADGGVSSAGSIGSVQSIDTAGVQTFTFSGVVGDPYGLVFLFSAGEALDVEILSVRSLGPLTALPMDDGNGPDLRDISGNGNTALLSETGYAHLIPEFDGSISRAGQDFSSSGLWIGARSLLPDNSVITGAVIDGQWISPAAISQDSALKRIYVTNTAGALTFSRTSGTSAGTTVLSITPSDDSDVDVTIYWKTVTQ